MPVGRLAVAVAAVAVLLPAGQARADAERDPSLPDSAQAVTIALGIGVMTTRGALGNERVPEVSASGTWFPGNGRLGLRGHLGFANIKRGTTYVNSERIDNLASVMGCGRTHLVGPLYGFVGAGAGALTTRSKHVALADEMSVWSTRPALTWTAGIELSHDQVIVRADHVGSWHSLSRDMVYSIHVGLSL